MLKDTLILVNRPEKHFLGSFYYKKVKVGIDSAVEGSPFNVVFAVQDDNLPDIINSKKNKIAGVISIAPDLNSRSLQILESEKLNAMLVNCRSERISWVDLDNECGASVMAEHLIKLGHEKILFIGGFLNSQNSIDRFNGFKKALARFNIEHDPRLNINCDFSITISYEKMKEFLRHKKGSFTAVFASNDLMAVGAVRALIDENIKVPDEIAVVGFDDFDFASTFYIPLTTYRQPFGNMGFIAAKTVMRGIENGNPGIHQIELIGEKVIRDSCGYKKKNEV